MKNIGILVYDASLTGGAENVAINLANELSSYYNMHLISLFNEKKKKENNELRYKKYVVNEEPQSITAHLHGLAKKLKRYLVQNDINVLLSITAGVNTVAIMATKHTNIKTIYCEHSNLENKTYGKKHQVRQWLGARYMDKIVTLTHRDEKNFINMYKIKKEKVIAIPNCFNNRETDNKIYKEESKKIITVGRLEKVKGHDLLIKVAKRVKEKHNDWKWDIYGEGKYRNEIEENIKNNDLADFITLKGNVNNLHEIYNDYAIFVLTSYYEGLPLVLLEAQQAKLPIVSFDSPTGPSEIIEQDVNGFLIECYDVETMANKISELIEDKEKRIRFSNNSQINIEKFEKDKIIKSWKELIDEI